MMTWSLRHTAVTSASCRLRPVAPRRKTTRRRTTLARHCPCRCRCPHPATGVPTVARLVFV